MISAFGLVIYGLSMVGSFSLGYLLLRTAFPEKQKLLGSKKLGYGYAIGTPIILVSSIFGESYFFFVFAFITISLFTMALGKRLSFKEDDFVSLEKIKRREIVPEKALTKEEKQAIREGRSLQVETKTPVFEQPKKKIVASDIFAVNDPNRRQVFKESNANIESISNIESVSKKIESNDPKEKEKKAILERLKKLAKNVTESEPLEKEKDDDLTIEGLELEW